MKHLLYIVTCFIVTLSSTRCTNTEIWADFNFAIMAYIQNKQQHKADFFFSSEKNFLY